MCVSKPVQCVGRYVEVFLNVSFDLQSTVFGVLPVCEDDLSTQCFLFKSP